MLFLNCLRRKNGSAAKDARFRVADTKRASWRDPATMAAMSDCVILRSSGTYVAHLA